MIIKAYKDDYGFHFRVRIFNHNLELQTYKTHPTTGTFGIRNNTPSGHRVLFLDYDEHLLEFIKPELEYLQKKYKLSEFYIFKSSIRPNGFHAINIDKLNYREFLQVIGETSADEYYRKMPITTDMHSWVLRSLKKKGSITPKLVTIIKSPYQERKKSLAHYLYLKWQYGLKKKPKNLDNNKKLYSIIYGTMNYTEVKDIPRAIAKNVR